MPVFAEAFGYTPAEFRAIRHVDFVALTQHLAERAEKAKRDHR